jgi:High-temperature-induced dauer-formation protein
MQGMKYNPAGWRVPYEHMVVSDLKKPLATYCLQILLVLLTHRPDAEDQTALTAQPFRNNYRFYCSKLHRKDDFQLILDGINRFLSFSVQGGSMILPGSQKQTVCDMEAMMLFWEIFNCNKVCLKNYIYILPKDNFSASGPFSTILVEPWIFSFSSCITLRNARMTLQILV